MAGIIKIRAMNTHTGSNAEGIVVVGVPRLGDNFFSVALIEKRASFIHHGAQTFH